MMMRALLLVLILVVVAALVAVATGFVNIDMVRGAQAPRVTTTREGIAAKGGQTPAFDVTTGQVGIGARETTVKVPAIVVHPANGNAAVVPQDQAPANRPSPAPAPANDGSTSTSAVQR